MYTYKRKYYTILQCIESPSWGMIHIRVGGTGEGRESDKNDRIHPGQMVCRWRGRLATHYCYRATLFTTIILTEHGRTCELHAVGKISNKR